MLNPKLRGDDMQRFKKADSQRVFQRRKTLANAVECTPTNKRGGQGEGLANLVVDGTEEGS